MYMKIIYLQGDPFKMLENSQLPQQKIPASAICRMVTFWTQSNMGVKQQRHLLSKDCIRCEFDCSCDQHWWVVH